MISVLALLSTAALAAQAPRSTAVAMPGGQAGIGFDDLFYSRTLDRVVVPAGRTGRLDLIDPATEKVVSIEGFPSKKGFTGEHDAGITSADEGEGLLFTTDRTDKRVYIVDPGAGKIVGSAALAAGPDYVRYVAPTKEVWVTEPHVNTIEIFSLTRDNGVPTLRSTGTIKVPKGGPEALAIDASRGRAYTHLWHGETLAIDLKTRQTLARWPNGCKSGEGVALDDKRNLLIVGCIEGRAAVLDLNRDGKQLSSINAGEGVDIIAYSPALGHLYMPGSGSATVSFVDVSDDGKLTLLATAKAKRGSHCGVADAHGGVWVCDTRGGSLLHFKDPFPASRGSAPEGGN